MINRITVDPFMQDHLTKDNKKIVPVSVRTVINDFKAIEEKQLHTFVFDLLVAGKVPISQKITLNKIGIILIQGSCNVKLNFLHPNLLCWKWIQLVNTEKLWLKNCLIMKLTKSLKALEKMVKMASNFIMAQKLKLLNGFIHQLLYFCNVIAWPKR